MIYLILKMLIYLLLALFAGAGAGWLLRNLAAGKREEEMQRTLADARARVPQFESLLRSRDEQIVRLKDDLTDKDVRINSLLGESREKESSLRDKDREVKQLTARNSALELTGESGAMEDTSIVGGGALDVGQVEGQVEGDRSANSSASGTVTLMNDIACLEKDLSQSRAITADGVAEAAAAEAEIVTLKADLARAGSSLAQGSAQDQGNPNDNSARAEVEELEARLRQKAQEYERLNKMLETEQRKVMELERERELQNKSLQVLHQQLELERERGQRTAAG